MAYDIYNLIYEGYSYVSSWLSKPSPNLTTLFLEVDDIGKYELPKYLDAREVACLMRVNTQFQEVIESSSDYAQILLRGLGEYLLSVHPKKLNAYLHPPPLSLTKRIYSYLFPDPADSINSKRFHVLRRHLGLLANFDVKYAFELLKQRQKETNLYYWLPKEIEHISNNFDKLTPENLTEISETFINSVRGESGYESFLSLFYLAKNLIKTDQERAFTLIRQAIERGPKFFYMDMWNNKPTKFSLVCLDAVSDFFSNCKPSETAVELLNILVDKNDLYKELNTDYFHDESVSILSAAFIKMYLSLESPFAFELIAKVRSWAEKVQNDGMKSILIIIEYLNPDELFDLLEKKLNQEVSVNFWERSSTDFENFIQIKRVFAPILTSLKQHQAEECIGEIKDFITKRWHRCDDATLIYLCSLYNRDDAISLLSSNLEKIKSEFGFNYDYRLILEHFDWMSRLLPPSVAKNLLDTILETHKKEYTRYSNYFESLPDFALRYIPFDPEKAKSLTDEAYAIYDPSSWTKDDGHFKDFHRDSMEVYQRIEGRGIKVVLKYGHTKSLKRFSIWNKPVEILRTYRQIQASSSEYREDVETVFLLHIANINY